MFHEFYDVGPCGEEPSGDPVHQHGLFPALLHQVPVGRTQVRAEIVWLVQVQPHGAHSKLGGYQGRESMLTLVNNMFGTCFPRKTKNTAHVLWLKVFFIETHSISSLWNMVGEEKNLILIWVLRVSNFSLSDVFKFNSGLGAYLKGGSK